VSFTYRNARSEFRKVRRRPYKATQSHQEVPCGRETTGLN
jgi:hypothetical protein